MNEFFQDDFTNQQSSEGTNGCWQLTFVSDVDKSCDYPPPKREDPANSFINCAERDDFYDETFINTYPYDASAILHDNGEFLNPPRKAANVRERKRMYSINHAFEVGLIISQSDRRFCLYVRFRTFALTSPHFHLRNDLVKSTLYVCLSPT